MTFQISRFRVQMVAAGMSMAVLATIAAQAPQTVQDEYAFYELLAPETASFRTDYEVALTSSGATTFFDRIGNGLEPVTGSGNGAFDLMTGEPLKVDRKGAYFEVPLARPVPADGQARLRILQTYKSATSYRREGNRIVFTRPLGIRRAAIVLPAGFQLTDCNVPAQVRAEPDGRIRVSFMLMGDFRPSPASPSARGGTGVALVIKAAPGAPIGEAAQPRALTSARSWEPPASQGPTERARLTERAHQDRDIVYFLLPPETNAFSLYHDYTESREGIDKYLNVVRSGSTVSKPSGTILDTGEDLKADVLTGAQMKAAGIDPGGDQVAPDQQVVVTHFAAVKKGQSLRLRLSETYTAPQSYRLDGDELVFERSLGRPRNSVVLPRGWYLTSLSIPGIVRQTPAGLTRIDFVNGRPDSIDVLLKGRRLAAQ